MFANFDDNKNDDFLDEFRQKLNTDSSESFEERKNEINRSKNVFIGTVSGIALAAVVGWFELSPRYAENNSADIPVIRRPQTAVKVQPAEPGGMEILNQDKSVYDIIEKKETDTPKVENLLPPPEEPQMPVISAVQETAPVVEQAEEIIKVAEVKVAPAPIPQAAPEEKPTEAPKTISQAAAETKAPIAEVKTAEKAPTPVAEQPKETPKTESKQEVKTVAVTGPWQVQLISSPNRKAVDTAWEGLIKKYPVLQEPAVGVKRFAACGIFLRTGR